MIEQGQFGINSQVDADSNPEKGLPPINQSLSNSPIIQKQKAQWSLGNLTYCWHCNWHNRHDWISLVLSLRSE